MEYEQSLRQPHEIMKNVSRVCLTTDCWTYAKNESLIAVTGHCIDDFKTNSVILCFDVWDIHHTGANLAKKLKENERMECEKKMLIGSNNACNIKNAMTVELHYIHELLLCYIYVKLVQPIIEKIKTIVAHFNRSSISSSKWNKFQRHSGIETNSGTRWNSTFHILHIRNVLSGFRTFRRSFTTPSFLRNGQS